MTSPSPLVTIAIPLYRAESFIAATIQSVIDQTWTNWELLIYDDASPDRSLEIAYEMARRDHRVRVIPSSANLGPEGNWNRCLSAIRGKYFKLLCGDDLLEPTCLEQQIAVLEDPTNQDAAFVTCGRWVINPQGRRLLRRALGTSQTKFTYPHALKVIVRSGGNPAGEPGAGLIRSTLIPLAGNYSAQFPYVIDLDYWCKLLPHGAWISMPECLCSFRVSGNSWTSRIGWKQAIQYMGFVRELSQKHPNTLTRLDLAIASYRSRLLVLMRVIFFRLFARS
jgi:glycosyltransferase involved in cell wall biosynthesis